MASRFIHIALWLLVFLLPVKFGGLVLLPDRPANAADWCFSRWPLELAVVFAVVWAAVAMGAAWRRRGPAPGGWAWLPLVWIGLQWLSAGVSPWPGRAWLVARGLGVRSQRYALVAQDGRVTHLAIEAPGGFDVSRAEAILAAL